jgi:hypothetical protein
LWLFEIEGAGNEFCRACHGYLERSQNGELYRLSGHYPDAKDNKRDIEAKKKRVVKLNIVKLEESKLFERQRVPIVKGKKAAGGNEQKKNGNNDVPVQ